MFGEFLAIDVVEHVLDEYHEIDSPGISTESHAGNTFESLTPEAGVNGVNSPND